MSQLAQEINFQATQQQKIVGAEKKFYQGRLDLKYLEHIYKWDNLQQN